MTELTATSPYSHIWTGRIIPGHYNFGGKGGVPVDWWGHPLDCPCPKNATEDGRYQNRDGSPTSEDAPANPLTVDLILRLYDRLRADRQAKNIHQAIARMIATLSPNPNRRPAGSPEPVDLSQEEIDLLRAATGQDFYCANLIVSAVYDETGVEVRPVGAKGRYEYRVEWRKADWTSSTRTKESVWMTEDAMLREVRKQRTGAVLSLLKVSRRVVGHWEDCSHLIQ